MEHFFPLYVENCSTVAPHDPYRFQTAGDRPEFLKGRQFVIFSLASRGHSQPRPGQPLQQLEKQEGGSDPGSAEGVNHAIVTTLSAHWAWETWLCSTVTEVGVGETFVSVCVSE